MVVVVGKRSVLVLALQRTRDVELLVDDLTAESQSGLSAFSTAGDSLCLSFSGSTLEAHRDEEEDHAGEGETAGVAQVACVAESDRRVRASPMANHASTLQNRRTATDWRGAVKPWPCRVVKNVWTTEEDMMRGGNVPSCLMSARGRMTQALTMMIK